MAQLREANGMDLGLKDRFALIAASSRGWGEPEEIAAVVTFLVSERTVFITGTTIQIDGGSYPGLL